MPTSPRRVRLRSGRKNGHAYTVSPRADVGIGPYGIPRKLILHRFPYHPSKCSAESVSPETDPFFRQPLSSLFSAAP